MDRSGPGATTRGPRHVSAKNRLRRWRHRHSRQRLQDYQASPVRRWPRRLVRVLGVLLLAVGSLVVYLVAWQLITTTVSDDVHPPRPRQVQEGVLGSPPRPAG